MATYTAYDPSLDEYDSTPLLTYTGETGFLFYKEYQEEGNGY
jgi:hypothetical protein